MNRYPEVAPEDMYYEQRLVFEAVNRRRKGGVEGPFVPLVHAPGILDRLQSLGEHCRFHTGVPDKLRELAIIITARHVASPFEFHVHAVVSRRFGLADAVIDAVAANDRPPGMDESLVYDFCTALFTDGRVSDKLFMLADFRFGKAVVLDLVATCGYYGMLGLGINVTHPPAPPSFFEGYVPAFNVPND